MIFAGVCSNVNEILMGADVFLMPSLYEGLGIVLIEAQASGVNSFTSKDVVPREVKCTDLIEFISLEKSADFWAEQVINTKTDYSRVEYAEIVKENGYDITSTIEFLEKAYEVEI